MKGIVRFSRRKKRQHFSDQNRAKRQTEFKEVQDAIEKANKRAER